jgi:predicted CXXCH cytochrome family protein
MLRKFKQSNLSVYWIVVFIIALGAFSLIVPQATFAEEGRSSANAIPLAQNVQSDDLACRICHEDTEQELSFPSGETVPVQVDLEALNHSAHGTQAENPLVCTDCHIPVNDYQVPHTPVEAFDYRGYQLEKAVSCERCHQEPHVTSHPGQDTDMPVTCTDCHGSHEVQTVDAWQTGDAAQVCVDCHIEMGTELTSLVVLNNLIQNGMFADAADSDYCLACHSQPGLSMTFPNGDVRFITVKETALHDSVHGADNSWQALECADCHENDIYPHEPITANSSREYSIEQNQACSRCHEENFEKAADSVHALALEDGVIEAAVCIDCHGAHDVPAPNEPRERISHTCEQCHSDIFKLYETSVHGDALLSESNEDVPTCIECHGVHDINDPTTTLARLRSPQLCADCHADTELMNKYDISTDVFETYVSDFHGTTVALFEKQDPTSETNKAVCYDCHGVHNIKSPDDPHAGIKSNLLVTCQECHPDATSIFSDAWTSHFKPSLENNTLVYLVDLFYMIVIPLTLGFFILLISTDVFYRVRVRLQRDDRSEK